MVLPKSGAGCHWHTRTPTRGPTPLHSTPVPTFTTPIGGNTYRLPLAHTHTHKGPHSTPLHHCTYVYDHDWGENLQAATGTHGHPQGAPLHSTPPLSLRL